MSLFNRVNIQDMESRLNHLESNSEKMNDKEILLNKNQVNFLKKYFKFQSNLIRKIEKDNLMHDRYVIISSKKGGQYDDVYIALTKNVMYFLENKEIVLKFRLIHDRLLLEFVGYPSVAFSNCQIDTYKNFFSCLFVTLRRVLDFPTQFIVGVKNGLNVNDVENKIKFNQFNKYL